MVQGLPSDARSSALEGNSTNKQRTDPCAACNEEMPCLLAEAPMLIPANVVGSFARFTICITQVVLYGFVGMTCAEV